MRRLSVVIGLILGLALPAAAFAAAAQDANVVLAKGDNRAGNYYVGGQTITVDGDVAGDVVCGGQTVVINGSVGGDVLCGSQTLTVNGQVAGSVRAGGQLVTLNGSVGRNVTVGAQNFVLGANAKVGGDVAVGAQTILLGGQVAHSAYLGSGSVNLNGLVGGSVTASVMTMNLGRNAKIGDNLDYTSDQAFTLDRTKVAGQVTHHASEHPAVSNAAADRLGMLLYWLVAALAGMLLAIWVAPRLVRGVTNQMLQRWEASVGWGVLMLIGLPVVLLLLAAVVFGLWLTALLTSGLFAGVALGRLAFKGDDSNRGGLALAALVGIPLVVIAGWLPVLGFIVGVGSAVWTLGGIALAINRARALG